MQARAGEVEDVREVPEFGKRSVAQVQKSTLFGSRACVTLVARVCLWVRCPVLHPHHHLIVKSSQRLQHDRIGSHTRCGAPYDVKLRRCYAFRRHTHRHRCACTRSARQRSLSRACRKGSFNKEASGQERCCQEACKEDKEDCCSKKEEARGVGVVRCERKGR